MMIIFKMCVLTLHTPLSGWLISFHLGCIFIIWPRGASCRHSVQCCVPWRANTGGTHHPHTSSHYHGSQRYKKNNNNVLFICLPLLIHCFSKNKPGSLRTLRQEGTLYDPGKDTSAVTWWVAFTCMTALQRRVFNISDSSFWLYKCAALTGRTASWCIKKVLLLRTPSWKIWTN